MFDLNNILEAGYMYLYVISLGIYILNDIFTLPIMMCSGGYAAPSAPWSIGYDKESIKPKRPKDTKRL